MFRFILILILTNLLLGNAHAGRTVFKNGNIYEGQIKWTSSIKYDLPPGKWKQIDNWGWDYRTISARGLTLIQEENGKVTGFYELSEINTNGKYIGYLNNWLQEIFFKDKYDGCYERPEYYLLLRIKKGASFNCFKVRHYDVDKRMHAPDDQWAKVGLAGINKYFENNSTEIPKLMLARSHIFYNMTVSGSAFTVLHMIDPDHFNGPKNSFITEDSSEYNRANIEKFPEHKKYMENFVSNAAFEHSKFEDALRARKKHKINFSGINMREFSNANKKLSENNSNKADQIISLTELYKSGVLSKEEFDNAMKKILN